MAAAGQRGREDRPAGGVEGHRAQGRAAVGEGHHAGRRGPGARDGRRQRRRAADLAGGRQRRRCRQDAVAPTRTVRSAPAARFAVLDHVASSVVSAPLASNEIWLTVNDPVSALQPRPSPETLSPGCPALWNGARSAPWYVPGTSAWPVGATRLTDHRSLPSATETVTTPVVVTEEVNGGVGRGEVLAVVLWLMYLPSSPRKYSDVPPVTLILGDRRGRLGAGRLRCLNGGAGARPGGRALDARLATPAFAALLVPSTVAPS